MSEEICNSRLRFPSLPDTQPDKATHQEIGVQTYQRKWCVSQPRGNHVDEATALSFDVLQRSGDTAYSAARRHRFVVIQALACIPRRPNVILEQAEVSSN